MNIKDAIDDLNKYRRAFSLSAYISEGLDEKTSQEFEVMLSVCDSLIYSLSTIRFNGLIHSDDFKNAAIIETERVLSIIKEKYSIKCEKRCFYEEYIVKV